MHIFSRTYGIGARPYNPVEAGSFSAPPLYWNRRTLHHTVVMLRHLYSYPIIHKVRDLGSATDPLQGRLSW